ncbi:YidB family protein [Komagataeibacter xylinus]|uniref:YidB family protein n=1 Tax=Komagataeibacter xylinus TaxID=28448 RepID=UPI00103178FA|nr:YidB family protein [Komagataeibacter xylinus]
MSGIFNDVMGKLSDLAGAAGLSEQVHSYLAELLTPATITNLLNQAEQAGLGDKVRSWIGNGHNLPISTDELRTLLSNQQVQAMVDKTGLPAATILPVLAHLLPEAVNTQTPADAGGAPKTA